MKIIISEPSRPSIPEYGISEKKDGRVTWDNVNEWMLASKNYWINTTKKNGNPHARPIWGIWLDNMFYFGGGSKTQNVKNLKRNPNIVVHTESGQKVVIIEGSVVKFEDNELEKEIGDKYEKKYGMFHPPPFWRVVPRKVFAWDMDDFANTPTKFNCTLVD